ncbi:uncharacterized protein HKW66_Vig0043370 [Vigna angularis]|uniref:Uncharacterized protein n=1 Tax=Phaseolus angularis TaxID=3914 RepID=A0A8T0L0Q8_PHAAN|nr:uncharacterized protein HKW66_Vig0043370 [Vigna angularis]
MVDAALWIPSHFLVARDHHINNVHFHAPFSFPSEFHYDLGLSSLPLESLAGSTKIESSDDEEDFFVALTRRLNSKEDSGFSRVPAVHAYRIRELVGLKRRFRRRKPEWVVRPKKQCGSVWGRPTKHNWIVQQQQVQVHNRACEFGHESVNVKCTRPTCFPQFAWSPCQVQQQNNRVQFGGSGSRVAVGKGGSSVKRGCGGNGVFLPSHYETTPSKPRKKTGSAPVDLLMLWTLATKEALTEKLINGIV